MNFSGGAGIVSSKDDFAYCPENVKVSGGYLSISCSKQPITAPVCGGGGKRVNYRVGEVNTKNKFHQTYGWFEARIKFPKARSLIPAFWLMPAPGTSMIDQEGPRTGSGAEVNIVEHHTHWMGGSVAHSLWWGGYGANLQGGGIGTIFSPIYNADGWHTYALNWEPGLLEFYVDGVKTQTYTGEGIPFGDEFLILSMAAGTWGQPLVDSELPSAMLVDYVKVYKKVPGSISQSEPQPQTEPQPEPEPQQEPPVESKLKKRAPSVIIYNDDNVKIKYVGSWGERRWQ